MCDRCVEKVIKKFETMPAEEKSAEGRVECFFCGNEHGKITDPKGRAVFPPEPQVYGLEPCMLCGLTLSMGGVILISVADDDPPDGDLLFTKRSGGYIPVKREAVTEMFSPEDAAMILGRGFALIPDSNWDQFELPREGITQLRDLLGGLVTKGMFE